MSELIKKIDPKHLDYIEKINRIDLTDAKDSDIKNIFEDLRIDAEDALNQNSKIKINLVDDFIIQTFAIVKEAVRRKMSINIHDEQLWAAMVLNECDLAEMATGEGKTLVAVFCACLNALYKKGIHIYTFNDYLAKRDAINMSPIYNMLGYSVGFLSEGQPADERKKAYACDITYMTVKECGFDYLRDFIASDKENLISPSYNFAIIDEADSILIDEARIPLVIAASTYTSHEVDLIEIARIVDNLTNNVDYEIDENDNNIYLNETGIEAVEGMLGISNLYDEENLDIIVCVNHALHAKELVKKDVDYIVRNNAIELVDEFTGRVAQKRHWPHGLHEAIEAKEGLTPSKKGQILGQITISTFIKLYPRIAGMTGTAASAAPEFYETYDLRVHQIPTHNNMIRIDNPDLIFFDKYSKQQAIIEKIKQSHAISRPVLIGTSSVEESEELSGILDNLNIECQVLNAKNDEMEAHMIANAGNAGVITVSTNMAGRGTDIKLGGIDERTRDQVIMAGGLLIIGTNRHESLRIDNQLRGRAGRQGDPGETQFFISLEDELFVKYNFDEILSAKHFASKSSHPITDETIIKESRRLQKIVEGQHHDMRTALSKYTTMLQDQSDYIRKTRFKVMFTEDNESIYFKNELPQRFDELVNEFGLIFINKIEKEIILRVINQCWADYLDNMAYIKDSIHILKMSGKDPLFEYNRILFDSFYELKTNIHEQVLFLLETVPVSTDGVDLDAQGLIQPASTWTYIVSNSAEQLSLFPFIDSLAKITKKNFFE